jgi:hypothetical protein
MGINRSLSEVMSLKVMDVLFAVADTLEVPVLPLEGVLDAVIRLISLPMGPNKNGTETLVSLCVTLGLSARAISRGLNKTLLVGGMLKHQFDKHQYKMILPVNTRFDLLAPTREARAHFQQTAIALSHHSVGVQTDPTPVPLLSQTLCSLVTPGIASTDASTQTQNRQTPPASPLATTASSRLQLHSGSRSHHL